MTAEFKRWPETAPSRSMPWPEVQALLTARKADTAEQIAAVLATLRISVR